MRQEGILLRKKQQRIWKRLVFDKFKQTLPYLIGVQNKKSPGRQTVTLPNFFLIN